MIETMKLHYNDIALGHIKSHQVTSHLPNSPHKMPNLEISEWCDAVTLTGFDLITAFDIDYTWDTLQHHISAI